MKFQLCKFNMFKKYKKRQVDKTCLFYKNVCLIDYPKNAIKMPAATAEPITPETLDDMQ